MTLVGSLSFVFQKIRGAKGDAQQKVDVGELGLHSP